MAQTPSTANSDNTITHLVPPNVIPPHPSKPYDLKRRKEQAPETASDPGPISIDPNIDPAIYDLDMLIRAGNIPHTREMELNLKALPASEASPPIAAPTSRFSLVSKPVATLPTLNAISATNNINMQPASSAKPVTIPRWLTDTIARLEAQTQQLQEELRDTRDEMSTKIRTLNDEMGKLREMQDKSAADTRTDLQTISSTVTQVVDKLATIDANAVALACEVKPNIPDLKPIAGKKRRGKKNLIAGGDGELVVINERDNMWNVSEIITILEHSPYTIRIQTGVRKSFLKAIGVNAPRDIRVLHPHPDGAQIKGDQIRPDFTKDWGDNSAWHALMVDYVAKNIQSIHPIVTAELLQQNKHRIFEQLHKIFKNYAKVYCDTNEIMLTSGAKSMGKPNAQITHCDGRKRTMSRSSSSRHGIH